MALTTPTEPNFPQFERPVDSRSPSKSPRKKAQFAIRELDPLLANLSPDSTLRALRATDTIPGGGSQDALASSIGDASPAEREIGIRAAFAAQKLREWRHEVSKWTWPGTKERSMGLGFITPRGAKGFNLDYRGFLTVTLAEHYEARIDEIRDDLDTLGIEDIKDHVLEAHVPAAKASPKSSPYNGSRTSYGRMRDFTALVTATVIQALPDLAKLNMLLDNWDIRLRVLRQLPRFLEVMDSTTSEIRQAFDEIQSTDSAAKMTEETIERQKVALGAQVADLGRRVDRLLDMLEGRDDSLPQTWIDRLEKVELDYATWVVEAQQVVLRNNLAVIAGKSPRQGQSASEMTPSGLDSEIAPSPQPKQHTEALKPDPAIVNEPRTTHPESSSPSKGSSSVKRKPSLKLNLSADRIGHRREISKVSVADSTMSGFSDLSNAEIMDARETSVLPSPKISLVDNPFRASRDELTWFGNSTAAQQQLAFKPPMLQRASTASVEVVSKDQLKRVMLRRSASWDMLSAMPESSETPESTPSKALRQLTGAESPLKQTAAAKLEASEVDLDTPTALTSEHNPLASPSLEVEPLKLKTKEEPLEPEEHPEAPSMPALPRRSSKRNTQNILSTFTPLTPVSSNSPVTPVDNTQTLSNPIVTTSVKETSPSSAKRVESLEDKIQDILTTLPTKIRLAKDVDYSGFARPSSTSSTRSSTPTAALTLSPVRAETFTAKSDDSGIRLYHLTRSGQARDAPPVKLFVRSVGDGQRVMVRVGGGWADLGEYLKEYSLHHGSRSTVDGRLEVASFPTSGHRDASTAHNAGASQGSLAKRKSRSPALSPQTADTNSVPELANPRLRPLTRIRSPELERKAVKDKEAWTPPPVPPIPTSYTSKSPTITTATNPDVGTLTGVIDPGQVNDGTGAAPCSRTTTMYAPGVTTTTTVTPATTTTTNYTPLGGAGPKTNPRRAATYATGSAAAADNDAWVENLVGKARAVSGGNANMIHQGPSTTTTTTTTTVSSSNTPTTNRRASSYMSLTPNASPVTLSPSPSNASSTASSGNDSKLRRMSLTGRSKSRMSLSDMSGIRRVFLRKKSENAR
ncbi:hypothetical protein H2204_003603 [Knufia peltigerae]|uniref:GAR domain-containing protein n=1 Tax=Knufia peltigerae TaxID=1002370 RepID=A0AA38Y946_9EURO|nr:hypothetical protein H2204_003603 [Knufia peltigerae]